MKSSLRVLLVIDETGMGGGQQHVLLLAQGLQARGHHVVVACAGKGYLVDRLREKGVDVVGIRIANRLSIEGTRKLVMLSRQGRYDIIHTHGGTAGVWGRLAGWLSKLKGNAKTPALVHTYHGLHSFHRRNVLVRMAFVGVERLLLRITTKVICVSEGDYRQAVEAGLARQGRDVIVGNGIDVQHFKTADMRADMRTMLGYAEEHCVVGMVGRFHVQKGHRYLIRAIPAIVQRFQQVRFLFVGSGTLQAEMENEVRRLGAGSVVRMLGDREDVNAIFSAMDIVVLPSLWEGYPLVLLEAAAAGKAIVASDIPGNREIVAHEENGLLVPAEDSENLADAILRLIEDVNLRRRLGREAQRRAEEKYGVDRMIDSVQKVYRDALGLSEN